MKKLDVVGLVEGIKIRGKNTIKSQALFDTGARSTSVDILLASKAQLGPVIKITKVRSASIKGNMNRPVVKAKIEIMGREFETEVNLQDRSHMTFPVIVGRNILAGNFLVDSEKNKHLFRKDKNNTERNGD
jgi:hypothetical protein